MNNTVKTNCSNSKKKKKTNNTDSVFGVTCKSKREDELSDNVCAVKSGEAIVPANLLVKGKRKIHTRR